MRWECFTEPARTPLTMGCTALQLLPALLVTTNLTHLALRSLYARADVKVQRDRRPAQAPEPFHACKTNTAPNGSVHQPSSEEGRHHSKEQLTKSTSAASPSTCMAETLLMLQASMLNTVFASLPVLQDFEVRHVPICLAKQLAGTWTCVKRVEPQSSQAPCCEMYCRAFHSTAARDSCYCMVQMRFDGQGRSMYLEWPAALTACQHLTRLTLEGCLHLPANIGNLVSIRNQQRGLLVDQLPTSVYQSQI